MFSNRSDYFLSSRVMIFSVPILDFTGEKIITMSKAENVHRHVARGLCVHAHAHSRTHTLISSPDMVRVRSTGRIKHENSQEVQERWPLPQWCPSIFGVLKADGAQDVAFSTASSGCSWEREPLDCTSERTLPEQWRAFACGCTCVCVRACLREWRTHLSSFSRKNSYFPGSRHSLQTSSYYQGPLGVEWENGTEMVV